MLEHWAGQLAQAIGLDPGTASIWVLIGLKLAIIASVFLPFISVMVMFSIWWERKVAGHIQSRVGPKLVGPFGLLQSVADGVKLILKEDLVPRGADSFLFRLAPYIAFAPVFTAFIALPFGPQLVFEAGLNIGVIYLLAMLSVEVMGVILAGWGSNSKWSVYGAMREACQMVSYEVPLGLSIICGVIVAGTLNLVELGYLQGAGLWDWFVHHNPFMMAAFLLFFIASLASNKRAPFDLPESESELVAGFHTEYSGIRWSFFFFAEYSAMFVIGAIQAALFLGCWNSPLGIYDPVYMAIGYDPVTAGQAYFSGAVTEATTWADKAAAMGLSTVGLAVLNVYGAAWFVGKAMLIIFVQIWLRWTLPRVRIDQVLHTCVKVLLPASLVALGGVMFWIYLVPQPAAAIITRSGTEQSIARLGHLVSPTPALQRVTQGVLMVLGVGIVLFFVGVIVWAWVHRDRQPRKTLFGDVMPVGREIHFTAGQAD